LSRVRPGRSAPRSRARTTNGGSAPGSRGRLDSAVRRYFVRHRGSVCSPLMSKSPRRPVRRCPAATADADAVAPRAHEVHAIRAHVAQLAIAEREPHRLLLPRFQVDTREHSLSARQRPPKADAAPSAYSRRSTSTDRRARAIRAGRYQAAAPVSERTVRRASHSRASAASSRTGESCELKGVSSRRPPAVRARPDQGPGPAQPPRLPCR